jgi:hypothetical protein
LSSFLTCCHVQHHYRSGLPKIFRGVPSLHSRNRGWCSDSPRRRRCPVVTTDRASHPIKNNPLAFKRSSRFHPKISIGRNIATTSLAPFASFFLGRASVSAPCIFVERSSRDRASPGPAIGRWNKYLEVKFPLRTRREGAISFAALFKRVAVDQLVMAPIGVRSMLNCVYKDADCMRFPSCPSFSVLWA